MLREKIDGVSFCQALAALEMSHIDAVRRRKNDSIKQYASEIYPSEAEAIDCAQIGPIHKAAVQNIFYARLVSVLSLARRSERVTSRISRREWAIPSDLATDLQQVKLIIELRKWLCRSKHYWWILIVQEHVKKEAEIRKVVPLKREAA